MMRCIRLHITCKLCGAAAGGIFMKSRTSNKTQYLTILAIFIAIVAVVQFFCNFTIGIVSFSMVLIPIVVGGAILGPTAGAILGFTFGLITLINGLCSRDPLTTVLLYDTSIKGTIVTAILCVAKATLAGWGAALIYKALKGKNQYLAVILAAAAAPIINTGIFVLAMIFVLADELFKSDAAMGTEVLVYLSSNGFTSGNVVGYVIFTMIGLNFIVEFLVNVVLSPAIYALIKAVSKGRLKA